MNAPSKPNPNFDAPTVRAAGILLCVGDGRTPTHFLLMRHPKRWDLPKGHCDGDETFLQTATREMAEETGIDPAQYRIDPGFRFDLHYTVEKKRYGTTPVQKQVRYYLAWTDTKLEVHPTEHPDYRWFPWNPPHTIQTQTINPLLTATEQYLSANSAGNTPPAE